MKRVPISELRPGMAVARDVADGKGGLLLRRGVNLSPSYIRALEDRGFAWVYVSDDATDVIVVEDLVSTYAAGSVQHVVRRLQSLTAVYSDDAVSASDDGPQGDQALLEQECEEIACVLNQVLTANIVTALARMASVDAALLSHGLDTAAVAVHFGMRMGLDDQGLCSIAAGCMLHDCGKALMGHHILLLPVLSDGQLSELRRHPLMGLQMARELDVDDPDVTAIIAQHHERQDGLGFPRGLRGNNRINAGQQAGRISLPAEIGALADTCTVLTTDTLTGARLDDVQVALTLRRMAGTMLNRRLVDHFLQGSYSVPVGLPAYVRTGRYAGCRGTVVRVSPSDRSGVVVRLMQDSGGSWMQPLEVDTAEERDAGLSAVLS